MPGLLSEFNGIWDTSEAGRRNGNGPNRASDIEHMTDGVPGYLGATDNVLPPVELAEGGIRPVRPTWLRAYCGECA